MKRLTHRQWLVGLGTLSVLICAFGFLIFRAESPSLGSQLEYIGQRQFGCLLVVLCESSNPYSDYYFATDMTEDQLKAYFKGATYGSSVEGEGADYTFSILGFQTTEGGHLTFTTTTAFDHPKWTLV
jgi:hypothetical protein